MADRGRKGNEKKKVKERESRKKPDAATFVRIEGRRGGGVGSQSPIDNSGKEKKGKGEDRGLNQVVGKIAVLYFQPKGKKKLV